jgi:hypothetical protein
MRRWWVLLLVFAACGEKTPPTVAGALPGATPACAAAGDFWPTMTLALDGDTAWVACKEESRIESLDGEELALSDQAIAVLNAFDAIWALDARGGLYRGQKVADLETAAAYNLWAGAGAMWSIDDRSGEVIRIDPESYEITKIAVGDGPADMVFDEEDAWVINHRDRKLIRIDTRTNRTRELATIGEENVAPERMALLDGSLWITGRGADLFKVDPDTGVVQDTIEIGGSGIDIVAAGGALWVPSRSPEVDQSGLPTMEALRRVGPDGTVTTVAAPSSRVDVHGLVADDEQVWIADNTAGRVYRIALDG